MSSLYGLAAASLLSFTISNLDDGLPGWKQKTPYVEPTPDHKAHLDRANAKRARKAEILRNRKK